MKIVILTVGSRGDVQPLVALGAGLEAAGNQVTVAASPAHAALVHGAGLGFAPLEGDPREILAGAQGRAWVDSGRNPVRFLRLLSELAEPLADRLLEDSMRACAGAQAIVWTPLAPTGYHIAERFGVPALMAALQPLTPTAEFAALAFPVLPGLPALGGAYNLASHRLLEDLTWLRGRPLANRWRQALGLPALGYRNPYRRLRAAGRPVLYGFSPRVVPPPAGWGRRALVTGYWRLDPARDWRPPVELLDFLASGAAPIGLTVGSMARAGGLDVLRAAVSALAGGGERALLIGDDALELRDGLPSSMSVTGDVPHDWLFPRLAAVLHHGGAGTTAAALRAGIPAVVTPFFADQHFWGGRVAELGAGPRPVPARRATAARLGAALDAAAHDPALRTGAAGIGRILQLEDGVAAAVAGVRRALGEEARSPRPAARPRIATR